MPSPRKDRRGKGVPVIWTPEQWAAALAPHRASILLAMDGLGVATALELAEYMGRSASSLYAHLSALVDADFLAVAREIRHGRLQRVFRRGPAMDRRPVDPRTGIGMTRVGEVAASLLGETSAQALRFGVFSEGHPVARRPDLHHALHFELAWLDAASLVEVLRRIEEIRQILARGRDRREGYRVRVALCCFRDVALREVRERSPAKGRRSRGGTSARAPRRRRSE